MGYASWPWRSEVDGEVYRFCADRLADAEYEAELYKELTLRHWVTVREIGDMAMAVLKEVGEGRPLEELHHRMAAMKRDAELLERRLPLAELLTLVARTADNFHWIVDQLPDGPRRDKAEAELLAWKVRMTPLLDRLGRPPARPVMKRRRLA